MQKKGFTLQELLVTLGIIGIVAAIVAPGVVGLLPDKEKSMYVKAYSTLTTGVSEILGDPGLYYTEYSATGEPNCSGMGCDGTPVIEPYNNGTYSGTNKFPRLFAERINLSVEPFMRGGNVVFRSADGIEWEFDVTNRGAEFETEVTIDVNPDSENDDNKCTYANPACRNPDLFVFRIDNDGGIVAVDRLGQAFLQNPTSLNTVKDDKDVANGLNEQ